MIRTLKKAARKVGSIAALARELNVTRQTLYNWQRVPADYVVQIEKTSGVPREELRPDLFR